MRKIWQTLLIILVLGATFQVKATEACASGLSDSEYNDLILGWWIQTEKMEINGHQYETRVDYRSDGTFTAIIYQMDPSTALGYLFGSWTINNQIINHKVTNTNLPFTKIEIKQINRIYETIICIGSSQAKFRDNTDGSMDIMIRG